MSNCRLLTTAPSVPNMPTPTDAITAYLLAKDGNRPHRLAEAFTPDATLTMRVNTDTISFPPLTHGREAIAQTLVRSFNQTYENVYTLCLDEPPAVDAASYSCRWLVAMSEKDGGAVRVGCGRYEWLFAPRDGRACALTISIEAMELLPADALKQVTAWMAGLSYPWCSTHTTINEAPDIQGVQRVLHALDEL